MQTAKWLPRIDIHTENSNLVIDADLPGMKKDEINIEIENGILRIFGERKASASIRIERNNGAFERTFELPYTYDIAAVKAVYRGGVLTLSIPKSAKAEPREIPVH